jgi:hypothetical protein
VTTNPLADRPLPDRAAYDRTRRGLHALAEQVLSPEAYRHTGRIGLRPAPCAISTPWVIVDGAKRCARIEGTGVVVIVGEERTAEPVTTVRAAAALVGVEPGAPPVYSPATPVDLDRPIELDEEAVSIVTDWYCFGDAALDRILAVRRELHSVEPILWPEHFDLAVTVPDDIRGEIVVGVSPGDDADPDPYAYVAWHGPSGPGSRPPDEWWNRTWGRWVPASEVATVEDLVDLFEEGLQRVR